MKRKCYEVIAGVAVLALAAAALAQPANDNCSGAIPVFDGDNAVDSTGATLDTTLPGDCLVYDYVNYVYSPPSASGLDVWYSYTAPVTGVRNFEITSSANSPDATTLAIYESCGGARLACNAFGGVGNSAKIYHFPVVAGTTYKVRFSVYFSGTATAVLNISEPRTPVMLDDCELAAPFAGQGTLPFDTNGLTNSDQRAWDCDIFRKDGWIAWTPAISGRGVVSACDAVNVARLRLSLYDACGNVPLLCNSTFDDTPNPFCSAKLAYDVVAGHTYLLRYGVTRATVNSSGNLLFEVRPQSTAYSAPSDALIEPGTCDDATAVDLNGGCGVTPHAYTLMNLCETYAGTASSRLSPVISQASMHMLSIDTDWYQFTLDHADTVIIVGQSEFPPRFAVRSGCDPFTTVMQGPSVLPSTSGVYSLNMSTGPIAPGTYSFVISPQSSGNSSNDCANGSRYWFTIQTSSGSCPGACCNGSVCSLATQQGCSGSFQGAGISCQAPGNPTTCCPANFNGAGGVSVQDIFDFLGAYFSSDSRADFNNSGAISVQDIFDFLAAYFTGCS